MEEGILNATNATTMFESTRSLVEAFSKAEGKRREELLNRIALQIDLMASNHEVVTHFKGKNYGLISMGYDSKDGSPIVIYCALYDDQKLWSRPLEEFFSYTTNASGQTVKRFYQED